ncbi:MAG: MATE family efflux transporter [Wenzhouxiangellaceae bacterium]|nr:MATE family efflux transporter [Wenzhouxiangellaceae bacterium]
MAVLNVLAASRHYFPNRDRRRALLALALPIIGGMMSQNILNLVDIAMVGRLGTTALAATGLGSFANWLSMAFILGLSTGVQAICARRVGQAAHGEIAVPLNGGLLLALILGLPLALIVIALSPQLLALINPDVEVVGEATPYLQVRLLALVAVGMNFSFRGYWAAVHRTGLYLATLLIMHMVNIFLNWVFIFGNLGAPALGVTGAGLATTLSVYLGTLIYIGFGIRFAWGEGFLHRIPTRRMLIDQMKLSLPSSLQQLFFSAGMVALITIVGYIGTRELAAVHVLLTLGLLIVLPSIAMGVATATMVGNALGREDIEDARNWGWNSMLFVGALGTFMGLCVIVFGKPILALFLTDPATLEVAYVPMLITGAIIGIDTAGLAVMHALLGAGDTHRVMKITIIAQWALFLPLATFIGPVLGHGLMTVWLLYAVYRIGQTVWFALAWKQGRWVDIKV